MSGDVIKEFLVGLGFEIDEAGLNKFSSAVGSASLKVMALGAATVAAATAVFAAVQDIADEYDQLDKLATRFRTTTEAVDEFADMAGVLGLSKEQSIGSLKALDQAIADTALGMGRAKMVFEELGIKVTDANGKMKPTTEVMDDLALKLKDMEKGKAIRVMERLGLDPALMKLFNADLAQLRQDLNDIDKAAGFDLGEAVAESKAFMSSWRALTIEFNKVKLVFEKLYESIGVKLMPKMRAGIEQFRAQIEQFRRKLMDNFEAIRNAIMMVIDFIMRGAEAFIILFMRVFGVVSDVVTGIISWFGKLDSTTQMVILGVLGIAAAWKYLNLAFLATPIGMILSLATALLLLYDDYMTWKEGGDSLIDWGAWEPGINSAIEAITFLRDLIGNAFTAIYAAIDLVVSLLTGDFSQAWFAVGELVNSVIGIFQNAWGVIKSVGESLGNFAGAIAGVFGGSDSDKKNSASLTPQAVQRASENAAQTTTSVGQMPALVPSPQAAAAVTNSNQQTIQQKTEINVSASSDAQATAKAIAGEQNRVNSDMARNMKGAAR